MSTATILAQEFEAEAKAALLGVLNEARAFVDSATSLLWTGAESIVDPEIAKARHALTAAFQRFERTESAIIDLKLATFYDPHSPAILTISTTN